jgi:murein DD-endopeptidase MepM/ murein hydrolase activator NlpD
MFHFFKKAATFPYPLAVEDAPSGENLKKWVPEGRLYKLGPFYCDKSPHSHKGNFEHAIDFLVMDGSLVYASRSGTVVDVVEDNALYGEGPEYSSHLNYVTIRHDDCLTQYAHLQKKSPSSYGIYPGKQVVRGQTIGIVGKTGWVDFGEYGDHLHFMAFKETSGGFESMPVTFK